MTTTEQAVACPKCGGNVWDNRLSKRNPKAPDFKCRDRNCDGAIWPEKGGKATNGNGAAKAAPQPQSIGTLPAHTAIDEGVSDRLASDFELYAQCIDKARMEIIRTGVDKLGGDVAGAVVAAAATLYIQAHK